MTPERQTQLLAAYAARRLAQPEESELLQAALQDDEIFEALVEEQIFRELLDDPASRRILIAEKKQWSARSFFQSAFAPAAGLALAGAAAALFFYLRPAAVPLTELAMLSPAAEQSLSPTYTSKELDLAYRLELSAPSTAISIGDQLQVTIGCSRPAQLVLLDRRLGERARIIYPGIFSKSAQVGAGESIQIPGNVRKFIRIVGGPGEMELVLLAFPPENDVKDALAGKAAFPVPTASRSLTISIVSR